MFFFAYPETSADNILRRRAQRLRKLTGASNIKSKSEIDQANLRPSEIAIDALIKPIEIMVKDPALAFTNLYVSVRSITSVPISALKDTVNVGW